jgi:hypothetical protein
VGASDGGGFSVRVPELVQLSGQARSLSGQVREVAAAGAGTTCVVSGAGQLDGQLARYQAGWMQQLQKLAGAEEAFATALLNAAGNYAATDASVMPSPQGGPR